MKPFRHIFDLKSQKDFSKLSGDYNPIHLDRIYARKILSGDILVYGINYVLWGLDKWLKNKKKTISINNIKISFLKTLKLNEEIFLTFNDYKKNTKIYFSNHIQQIAKIELNWKEEKIIKNGFLDKYPKKIKSESLNENKILGYKGCDYLCLNIKSLRKLYPTLSNHLNKDQISILLASSRIVGMKVPGLNSLFYKLQLSKTKNKYSYKIKYEVSEFDIRVKMINIDLQANNMNGHINSFIRPESKKQENFSKIIKLIKKNNFKNQRAFIVGGSRGLGEVTTKILSAGSAKILFTYNLGIKDAKNLNNEITKYGRKCKFIKIDVNSTNKLSLIKKINEFKPTHFYYFATPNIFSGAGFKFSRKIFDNFNDIYISGFQNIFEIIDKKYLKKVFYPSSIAVENSEAKLAEYAASKSASEILCKYLKKRYKNIFFDMPRLPRLKTDQTSNIFLKKTFNTTEIMIKNLIKFNKHI